MGTFFTIMAIIAAVIFILMNVKIVNQSEAYVVERLGAYHSTWHVGLKFKIPYVERIASRVSLKEHVVDFKPQPVITADNITMQIDTVVYYKIVNPELYAYGVDKPMSAIENLTATTLRNIIGELELDATLTSRGLINVKMLEVLDEATDPWGIKINRVEVKNILPPEDIQNAMEKQMRAERERRELIIIAEGQKKSYILVAEGEKDSQILIAEGQKQATILKSEAIKEEKRLIAEGEAAAILNLKRSQAHGIKMLKEAKIDKNVLALRSLEAFEKVADGRSTKIIIPSDLQDIAGLVAGISEINNTEIEDSQEILTEKY